MIDITDRERKLLDGILRDWIFENADDRRSDEASELRQKIIAHS